MRHLLIILAGLFAALPAAAIELCGSGARVTCVVDGDTVWIEGEKIRIEDIDTPENNGRCVEERRIAVEAAGMLTDLLNQGNPQIERSGKDRYGRTLARILVGGQSVSDQLIAAGLAKVWEGHKSSWCN